MSQTGNYLGTEKIQRLSAIQLAERDRIKNEVYAIINNGEKGVLISDFESAKEVVEKIAEYIIKDNPSNH